MAIQAPYKTLSLPGALLSVLLPKSEEHDTEEHEEHDTEKLNQIVLSKSSYKITSFIDFSPYAKMFIELKLYIQQLKTNLNEQVGKAGRYPPYHKVNGRIQNDIDRKRQLEI